MIVGVGIVARALVAAGFALAAGWKAAHPSEFGLAFRGVAPRRLAPFAREAVFVVAGLELLFAVLTMAGLAQSRIGWLGPTGILGIVVVFSIAVVRNKPHWSLRLLDRCIGGSS